MLPFLGYLIDAAVFWFIFVLVTQQHKVNWISLFIWFIFARILGQFVQALLLLQYSPLLRFLGIFLGPAVTAVALLLILEYRFSVSRAKERWTTVGIYFTSSVLLAFVF